MCQFNWTTGCPDIWPDVILGVSSRAFLDEWTFEWLNFEKSRLPSPMWVNILQSVEDLKRIKLLNKKQLSLPDWLRWDIGLFCVSVLDWNISPSWFSGLPTFRLKLLLSTLLFIRSLNLDWNYTSTFLGLQFVDCRSWDFSVFITIWANVFHIYERMYIFIYEYIFLYMKIHICILCMCVYIHT